MAAAETVAPEWMDANKWVADHAIITNVVKQMAADEPDTLDAMSKVTTGFGWTLNKASICAQKRKQHVGVYAGDAECFEAMAPVFDKVILEYHGVDVASNKATEETYEKVTLPALEKADAVVSTRIRTARNLKSLPFTVNMTKEQRLQLESTMVKVFDTFTGLLKGTYYPMVGMAEEKRKELVDAHYLYINDDPTLELVGCYDDWPQGRGIFINEDRSAGVFIIWVGEEDQLRIMAMNKGSDVQAVWDLFYSGVEAVHKAVKDMGDDFVFDPARGYLSSCPTNIGTGMRASVHVDLPAFPTKDICKKWVKTKGLMIDIRGTRGEATSTDGVTRYDVSNKARLGSDCVQQITTMVEGVKALLGVTVEEVEAIQRTEALVNTWTNVDMWVADHAIITNVCKTMKAEDPETFKKMCDVRTGFDWTLNKASVCAQKLKQHVGVYAGDAECFEAMAPVFDKVIMDYHGVDVATNEAAEEKYEKVTLPALEKADAIVSTRIRTARNLASLPFTVNMTKEQRLKLESTMVKVFETFEGKLKGVYYPMVGMEEDTRKELVDLHYLYINDDPTLELVGCYDDWPQGRGIFINEDRSDGVFIIWVGEEDQLRIMAMNKGSDVQAVWDLFYSGVEAVHKAVKDMGDDFVFDKARGYLSSCPTNIGTGMRASVHVDLPAFSSKQICKEWVKKQGLMIDIRGTRGEATSTDGVRRYDVSNKARLGSDCVTQITTMVDGVKKLLAVQESDLA